MHNRFVIFRLKACYVGRNLPIRLADFQSYWNKTLELMLARGRAWTG
ncbi:hypothetical protein BOS5A_10570 [Bosea sp. EC-HK365B]|nr:hypothetical protein BOSE46_10294 [Bosea sp. 46]CAD5249899.1 hypothetical protein BOSE21B_10504 [Bosea sp. 21B]CAD5266058.1 hypothetical protein BOSE7B_150633 [Bosea sp. 7B]VVT44733.1 hypothetical protein BOS5A_10570 [Bosea sp. EC-HK365B]VXB04691.1 hypothetical protein BOSE125_10291 [Bosea sp. 125]VXC49501.1 hypothetical protein BOSE127_190260 [Bosea sp. 127]